MDTGNALAGLIMEMSLYDRVGGSAAIHAVVELLYQKIQADSSLDKFFNGIEIEELKRKQRSFFAKAFGGPDNYDGQGLTEAHSYLVKLKGLNDDHFDSVAGHLHESLDELNVPADLANEIMEIAGSTRDAILGRVCTDKAA